MLVHGLYTDGFKWDDAKGECQDSLVGEMNSMLPMMHMEPQMDYKPNEDDYTCPLYKTAARAGVLSTTGQCRLIAYQCYGKKRNFNITEFMKIYQVISVTGKKEISI